MVWQFGRIRCANVRPVHASQNAGWMEDHSEGISLALMSPQISRISSGIVGWRGLEMSQRNTPQKTLESWKQIAGYLDRSERTVRRWEASEGLPVHRREHEKQDTVFAFRHEIEAWSRLHTKYPHEIAIDKAKNLPVLQPATNTYLVEHDAITRTMHRYIASARAGDGD